MNIANLQKTIQKLKCVDDIKTCSLYDLEMIEFELRRTIKEIDMSIDDLLKMRNGSLSKYEASIIDMKLENLGDDRYDANKLLSQVEHWVIKKRRARYASSSSIAMDHGGVYMDNHDHIGRHRPVKFRDGKAFQFNEIQKP